MSGETWGGTKTDWVVGEGIPVTWPNKIEGNISVLGRGNGRASLETAVGASNLVLPNETDETFLVSGDGAFIKYIDTTNRNVGNRIQLIKTGSGSIILNPQETDPPPGFARVYMYNSGLLTPGMQYTGFEFVQNMLIIFVLSHLGWHCTI